MRWHDFDRNGKVNGRDFYLMNLLLNSEEEEKEDSLFDEEDNTNVEVDDLW